jgi:hypothetical protein
MSSHRRLITQVDSECSRVLCTYAYLTLIQPLLEGAQSRGHWLGLVTCFHNSVYERPLERTKALHLSVPPVERDDNALVYINRALNRSKLGILNEVLGPTPPFTDPHVHPSHCQQLLEATAPLLSGASPVTVGYDCNICQVIGQISRPAVDAVMDHF